MSVSSSISTTVRGIDLRLTFVAVFLEVLAVWHFLEGTVFPDAVFFVIVGIITLLFAIIGLGAESGFEMGERERE